MNFKATPLVAVQSPRLEHVSGVLKVAAVDTVDTVRKEENQTKQAHCSLFAMTMP